MFFYLLKGRWRDSRYSFIGKTDGSTGMGCSETRPQMAAKSAEIPLGPTADRRSSIGKRVDTASTNHRSLRLFTAPSTVSCQQEFTAISNQRRAVGELLDADWRAEAAGK